MVNWPVIAYRIDAADRFASVNKAWAKAAAQPWTGWISSMPPCCRS